MNDNELRNLPMLTALAMYAQLDLTKRQFYKSLTLKDHPWNLYKQSANDIKKAEKLRASILLDRKLEVLYICGPSGSGKTTLAKYIAERKGYDPFVNGSGDDILDGYDREECIILDDFRAGTMKFNELLKFLDNNTGSSVKSRYFNKDINNCKLLIITSVLKPGELYSFFKDDNGNTNNEPIEQLYRRLKHHYLYMGINTQIVYEVTLKIGLKSDPKPIMKFSTFYDYFNINPDECDDNSIIGEFIDEKLCQSESKDNKGRGI